MTKATPIAERFLDQAIPWSIKRSIGIPLFALEVNAIRPDHIAGQDLDVSSGIRMISRAFSAAVSNDPESSSNLGIS
jgi:hypothetical protein